MKMTKMITVMVEDTPEAWPMEVEVWEDEIGTVYHFSPSTGLCRHKPSWGKYFKNWTNTHVDHFLLYLFRKTFTFDIIKDEYPEEYAKIMKARGRPVE